MRREEGKNQQINKEKCPERIRRKRRETFIFRTRLRSSEENFDEFPRKIVSINEITAGYTLVTSIARCIGDRAQTNAKALCRGSSSQMRYPVLLLCLSALSLTFAQSLPLLLLVSFDGFRHDYPQLHGPLENFRRLAQRGVRAQTMTASFTSATFPNHYT